MRTQLRMLVPWLLGGPTAPRSPRRPAAARQALWKLSVLGMAAAVSVITATIAVPAVAGAANLVTLSGTVTLGGVPASSVSVSLSDETDPNVGEVTTKTGPDGSYSLQAVSGDRGFFVVNANDEALGLPATNPSDNVSIAAQFTVGPQDMTENVTLPTATTVNVSVIDSDGNGISGANVVASQNGQGQGQLSDGTPTSVAGGPQEPTCTTDTSGQCALQVLLGIPLSIGTTYSPEPGNSSYPTFSGSTTTSVASDPSAATVTINGAANLVTLSGTVTLGGVPASSVSVSLSDETDPNVGEVTTKTGPDGSYSLQAVSGDRGFFVVNANDEALGLPATNPSDNVSIAAQFTVGPQDMTENVTLPTATTVNVSVIDSDGNGISGANVVASQNGQGQGQLSDGTPTSVAGGPQEPTCTTDTSGQCALQVLLGIPLSIGTTYSPEPGNSSYPTFSGSTTTSVASDPSAATVTIKNLADVTSAGPVAGSVLVASPGSTSISGASSSAVSSGSLPPGLSAPVGAVAYQVHNVPVGGSIDVDLALPPGTVPTAVDKLQNGRLIDVTSLATVAGNIVTLHLTDGGLGDADGVANGVVVDPVVPLTGREIPPTPFGVTTTSLPNAFPGRPYGPVTLQADGLGVSVSPYVTTLKWKKVNLPKGLKLSSAGVLSGTPRAKGTLGSSVTVQVTETVFTLNGKKKVKTTTTVQAMIPFT